MGFSVFAALDEEDVFFCSRCFPTPKLMFVTIHINPSAMKLHAFHLKPQSLLSRCLSAQLEFSTRTDDALPGEAMRRIRSQQPCNGPMI